MDIITKRGGSWYADFYYTDPSTGRRRRCRRSTHEIVGARGRQDAGEAESPSPGRHSSRPPHAPPTRKRSAAFSGFAKRWMEVVIKVEKSPTTAYEYESSIRSSLYPFFGDVDMREITPELVVAYRAHELRQRPVSQDGEQPARRAGVDVPDGGGVGVRRRVPLRSRLSPPPRSRVQLLDVRADEGLPRGQRRHASLPAVARRAQDRPAARRVASPRVPGCRSRTGPHPTCGAP